MNEVITEPNRSSSVIGLRRSNTIAKLAKALSTAQGHMKTAKKDSYNPFFKSSYADLAAVLDACREELSKVEIAYTQSPGQNEKGELYVDTLIFHSSDEWIEGRIFVHPVKMDPQSTGAAITYARRFALQSMIGIAAEDDDGSGTQGPQHPTGKGKLPEGSFEEMLSEEEKARIKESGELAAIAEKRLLAATTQKDVETIGKQFVGSLKSKLIESDLSILREKYDEALTRVKK